MLPAVRQSHLLTTWIVGAVLGVGVAVVSLLTRADCEPGSARLLDVTPFLPWAFGLLAAVAALVIVSNLSLRVVGLIGAVTTAALLVITALIASADAAAGSHCWTAF